MVEQGSRPVYIRGWHTSSDHVNDVTLTITDRDGPVTAQGGFKQPGEQGYGGNNQLNEMVHGPCTATLAGTGATAVIFTKLVQ